LSTDHTRVRVAAVNDYEVIVAGLAQLLEPYSDRLVVADRFVIGEPADESVDVALYDTYGRTGSAVDALEELVATPEISHVAMFSLHLAPEVMDEARAVGVTGFIWKGLDGDAIADAVVRVGRGETVVAVDVDDVAHDIGAHDWPGRATGLSERQSEVLALLAAGLTNKEIAQVLYLSPETVKDYVRQAFHKIGVRNRVEAANFVSRERAFRTDRHPVPPG
jgi:DNA-binding NarL/FixJ family response regulator